MSDKFKPILSAFWKMLWKPRLSSFGYLNVTQFIGAMNDNIFKLLIVYCFIGIEGVESSNLILATVGAIYVIPFLLFSQTAGMMADRFSKRNIIVATRIIELFVVTLGVVAFLLLSKTLAYIMLFFLATHSAIFAPCKYGIVPEIVPKEEISKANGLLTSFTYTAIIIGTFLASFLTDVTDRNFSVAASICWCFSLIALFLSLKIKKTLPSGSQKKVTPWFITELFRALRVIRAEPSLLSAVIGSAYFLFIGSFIQLNMIPYAISVLKLSDVQGGYLFLLTALGIGAGSLAAGKFSGKAVELGLVPIGGIGIAISCFMLDYCSYDLMLVILFVVTIGIFGGLYLVPLDSFIQTNAPSTYRGQIVATTNVLGFFGVLCSAATLYVLGDVIQVPPDVGFSIMGYVTLIALVAISISISGYVVRFFSYIISKIYFSLELYGKEQISLECPSIFFIPHSYWPLAMVLLASQRRRMRLFSLRSHSSSSIPAFLSRRLLPVLEVSSPDEITPDGEFGDLIAHSLQRGTSIGIFCTHENFNKAVDAWIAGWDNKYKEQKIPIFSIISSYPDLHSTKNRSRERFVAKVKKLQ